MPISGVKRDTRIQIRLALRGIGLAKDVVVVTPEEFEKYKPIAGTIVRSAYLEGKVLYDQAA